MNRVPADFLRKHIMSVLIWGVVVLFTVLYVSLIFNDNAWTDEVFTMQAITGKTLREITELTAIDVHPPLYYYYAKLFQVCFGTSLRVQKAAAILPMTGLLVFNAVVVRRLSGDVCAFLTNLFLACVPCSMEFAVQVRMYSLAIFFVTACGVFAYLAYHTEQKRYFALYSCMVLGAAYSHYFAFVPVVWTGVLLFCAAVPGKRRLIIPFLVSTLFQILCYLPWLPYMWKQVTTRYVGGFWIPPITPQTVAGYFRWTFGLWAVPQTTYVYVALLGALILFTAHNLKHKEAGEQDRQWSLPALLALAVPVLTCATGVILSILPDRSPVYRDQYIFPAMGLLALFFGLTAGRLRKPFLYVICAFLLFTGVFQYRECFFQEYKSTLLKETRAFMETEVRPEDVIVYNWEAFDFIYEYYFADCTEHEPVYIEYYDWENRDNRVFLLATQDCPMPDGDAFHARYTMENRGHFGIEHNEFDIYAVFPIETR